MIADQQAALFGYDCRAAGAPSAHTGPRRSWMSASATRPRPDTIKVYLAWLLDDRPTYCLEADTTVTGAVVRWLREGAGMISTDEELGRLAETVPDAAGLVFVPAFTGLNVPVRHPGGARVAAGSHAGPHARPHRTRLPRFDRPPARDDPRRDRRQSRRAGDPAQGGRRASPASDAACAIQADWLGIPVLRSSLPRDHRARGGPACRDGRRVLEGRSGPAADAGRHPDVRAADRRRRRAEGRESWRRAVDAVTRWAEAEG